MKEKTAKGKAPNPEQALFRAYLAAQGESNSTQITQLRQVLRSAIREELTELERRELLLYYSGQANIPQIAAMTGTCTSTVSRNIQRGKQKLARVLGYSLVT